MSNYYDIKDMMSSSHLKAFEVSANYYYDMINSDEELDDYYLLKGTAIHKYILENKSFFDDFIIEPKTKPTSSNQKLFCQLLAAGNAIEYSYSSSYTSYDEKKAENLKEKLAEYIKALSDTTKTLIPEELVFSCNSIMRNIESHNVANKLMLDDFLFFKEKSFNEKEFFFEIDGVKFKSKIDRHIIDEENKKIILSDLKTYTLKRKDENRKERIKAKFKYEKIYRQLYIYGEALKQYYKEYKDYEIEYWIVFASSNFYNYIDVLKVDDIHIQQGADETSVLLHEYKKVKKNNFKQDCYYYDLGYIDTRSYEQT